MGSGELRRVLEEEVGVKIAGPNRRNPHGGDAHREGQSAASSSSALVARAVLQRSTRIGGGRGSAVVLARTRIEGEAVQKGAHRVGRRWLFKAR
jgi:hypothetical protein